MCLTKSEARILARLMQARGDLRNGFHRVRICRVCKHTQGDPRLGVSDPVKQRGGKWGLEAMCLAQAVHFCPYAYRFCILSDSSSCWSGWPIGQSFESRQLMRNSQTHKAAISTCCMPYLAYSRTDMFITGLTCPVPTHQDLRQRLICVQALSPSNHTLMAGFREQSFLITPECQIARPNKWNAE